MIAPAHLPELWRLLVEHAEAVETANGEAGAALRTGDESAFTVASMRLERASRALYAFTRRAAAEPPPAADGTGEPAQQPDDLRARYCPGISIDCLAGGPECACMTATAEQRASIRAALAARDERIAALEAGLRDAADDLADHERWWRTVDEIAKADDALASIRAARALADAGKVTP